eukprot:11476400-Prorocentrum_lima.AAC.1
MSRLPHHTNADTMPLSSISRSAHTSGVGVGYAFILGLSFVARQKQPPLSPTRCNGLLSLPKSNRSARATAVNSRSTFSTTKEP